MPICYGRVRARKRKPSRSAKVIASDDNLLKDLLLRLPVKSLLKFRSVSKRWLSLISDPHFARRKHLKSNSVSALYLDCRWEDDEEDDYGIVALDPSETVGALERLKFAGYPRRLIIEQSCNGLLLLREKDSLEEEDSLEEDKYLVYNPTTKQSKTIPPVPALPPFRTRDEMLVRGASLAFDPSQSHLYKVVCILNSIHYDDDYYIGIYSSETEHWRVCGAPFTPSFLLGPWTGVYCNGAIHWVGSREDFSLYCDPNEELVREMPMPPPLQNCGRSHRYVGESRGRLYLVDSYERSTTHLDVYEMELDRSDWLLRFRVDSDSVARFTKPSEDIYIMSVLYVARGEKAEDSFMVLYMSDDMVIRYNFLCQTSREISEIDSHIFVTAPAHEYVETLSRV